ncbi:hypothetical protein B0T19DRAFT_446335 [Cercophora scortea]|uniref:Uncharacterized protein n=1 Tax=Cercophora scortea TaxID=314031 RepID=A0AAE0I2Q9_9PEZI|nr:hypothetical protein B0T19DRAFT_446335 [Cercophora scortea]
MPSTQAATQNTNRSSYSYPSTDTVASYAAVGVVFSSALFSAAYHTLSGTRFDTREIRSLLIEATDDVTTVYSSKSRGLYSTKVVRGTLLGLIADDNTGGYVSTDHATSF